MAPGYTIAVDVMGGDCGPHATLPASLAFLNKHPDSHLVLVGDQGCIESWIRKHLSDPSRVSVRHAATTIAMHERPSQALRRGHESSLYLAIQAVAEGSAQACVSAGNTGALMAVGRHLLGTFPGIDRPAIVKALPTRSGQCYMLDLGANVDCSANHLHQFALMGSALCAVLDGIERPRVALLNIGEEEVKGNEQVRLASRMIQEEGALNYIGFIEGDGLYAGRADVVVCDGFVGNVALKSIEGVARLISDALAQAFTGSLARRIVGGFAQPILAGLRQHLDPAQRNGASLLGLQGVLIKSHGAADQRGFDYALEQALEEVRKDAPRQIHNKLGQLL